MSDATPISLIVWVAPSERPIVEAAAVRLGEALSKAAGAPHACVPSFVDSAEALLAAPTGAVVVTSLLTALDQLDIPWADSVQTLNETYAKLAERGDPVMVSTILRHVPPGEDPGRVDALRLRIRRLNLLATELSREFGAFVIDLDRVIADIGAIHLQTDYRLGGEIAPAVAGNAMALCIVANALDDFVAFELQDKARAILAAYRPPVGAVIEIKPHELMALGRGRHRQRVQTVTDAHQDGHASWVIKQVLNGQIGPREAADKFVQAIQKRGVKESLVLLASGAARLAKRS
jgi:hypothetical protein